MQLTESKVHDGASAGCTGTTPHNASPKEVTALSTNLYCLPFTILHLCRKIPSRWAQHCTCKASSSIFAEQEDHLCVSLSHWLTAPQRCTSRLRDLVWMQREFLSCSSREQLKNGEQHLGAVDSANLATEKDETAAQTCKAVPHVGERHFPNPPMLLSQKSGENKTPAVQMEILKVTNSTSPVHPHCTAGHSPKHCTPSRWAKKWGFPYLTEEQPPGRRWLSQGYTAAGRGLAVSGNGNN